jgi:flagellar biosynthesis/type III secretory pathway protein FliH
MRTRATILRQGQHPVTPLAGDTAQQGDRGAVILRREVLAAKREAETILEHAEKQAQQLLQQTEQQARSAREAAERAGYEAGLALAVEQVVRVARKEEELDQRALSRSIEIAQLLAERVVGKTLNESPDALAEMARAALEEVRGARQVRFLVAPDDVECIAQALARDLGSPMLVQVEAHPDLQRGDFEMRTDKGVLTAKLADRLRLLAKVLAERLG